MKRWIVTALAMAPAAALAWGFGGGAREVSSHQGPGPEMAALLSRHTGTADIEIEIAPQRGKSQTMRGSYAVLEGMIRTELDMGRMEGSDAAAAATMKQMGMDKVVTIVVPGKKTTLVVYPGMKAYCEVPHGSEKAAPDSAPVRVDRKEIGRETVDGHPCVKYDVTVTPQEGRRIEMVVWEATDLDGFPVQIRMQQDGATITHRFKNVKPGKPDAALFAAPAGYKRHDSMQSMMMEAAMKAAPGMGR